MNLENVRKHIFVIGRVQGVGFRFRVQCLASGYKLTGWVRNLDDGRVEMELQGSEDRMRQLFDELNNDRFIRIKEIQAEIIPVVEEKGFRVR
ncbi:acylphosphatase [Lacrimispora sp. JR3]|uniref:acylphosphatase n=1 Tax=Lacrimispora sinapis TaxID=3111456 RepID=UPI00374968F8